MRIIATILADLDRSPLGTRSRLADDLAGRPVLRRTVERVTQVGGLDAVHVLCPAEQAERVRALLAGLALSVETYDGAPAPYAALVRTSRMWGLDAWRGGAGSLCAFDEDFHAPLLNALAARTGADAVLSIAAAGPLVSPDLCEAMIAHFREHAEVARLTIIQAPPGLGAFLIHRDVLADLTATNLPPGALLVYQPTNPTPDLTGQDACCRPPVEIIQARGRLLCDTRRSTARVKRLLDAGAETWDARRIACELTAEQTRRVEDVPAEIEIELTTDDPRSGGSLLRPRGAGVGRRGPITPEVLRRITEWIDGQDDVCVLLGGFGEPCLHPDFGRICRALRDGGAASLAVRTCALVEDPAVEAALFETPVDIIEVTLDAAGAETFRRVHGLDAYDTALARVERWIARRSDERRVRPLIVPSLVKANETLEDLEAFVDTWQRRLGAVSVTGYSHRAGQCPERAVTSMTPPRREPCRRVRSRAIILADGRMTTCDQDFAGRQALGSLEITPPAELWRSELLQRIRTAACPDTPLCPRCEEWHRP
ncbi:MAG: SPASM domain-containing protein [Phycisphaerae bacterium]